MTGGSALYAGHVRHQRLRPRRHRLDYAIYMALLDLDTIDACDARLRWFSSTRFNLFSFHNRDYASGSDRPLRPQIEHYLIEAGIDIAGGSICLLTMPRVLGFAFNPLSVYFCHHVSGKLMAILYEVNNTFGQRHTYLLPVEPDGGRTVRQSIAKQFHVSPFLGMDMDYAFRIKPPADSLSSTLSIAITGSDDQGALITAVLDARRQPLTDAALLRAFVSIPLVTFKVVAGILWEALRLWAKRVPVRTRPPAPAHPVTRGAVTRGAVTKATLSSDPVSAFPSVQNEGHDVF